jgi:hypothetical protein
LLIFDFLILDFDSRSKNQKSKIKNQKSNCRLLFLDRPDLALIVITAVGANTVRRLWFVALWAQARRRSLKRVVRAALGGARLGMASFWIRHRRS